ncbi:MAG: ATP-binding cassette domain-containing protein, partial [Thermoleophilia bacterium]|nr:ATP-binding cassette domain-containing protein [Thermoleophilia bacterium]
MIRLEDLRVDAGAFALRIEELALSSGEYLVIVGPTGSGKTVLLDTIAGMRRPAQGRVWFGDRDVTHEPPERRRTGVVYQDYALFPHLTVAGNIGFGLRGGGTDGAGGPDGAGPPAARGAKRTARSAKRAARSAERAAQVERLASLLGIQGLLDRYPDSLSGGERQRVALARA